MKSEQNTWYGLKVLVTGASGFKGSYLCSVLHAMGAIVYGTVRNKIYPDSAYHFLRLSDKITSVSIDLANWQEVYDTINSISPDVIFHLGAKALVPVANRDPKRTYEVNVMGTVNILEACRKLKLVKKLIICSTDHVFGSFLPEELPEKGFVEEDVVGFGGPYDTSKATMELIVRSYQKTYWDELPAIAITRCANVVGYGDINQRRVIPDFVKSSLKDKIIELSCRKNGRQFIAVSDAIVGYILVASQLDINEQRESFDTQKPNYKTLFTPTYHFALEQYPSKKPYITILGLANLIAKTFGSVIQEKAHCVDYIPKNNAVQALNCSFTRKSLGWKPHKTLAQNIQELGIWYEYLDKGERENLYELISLEVESAKERILSFQKTKITND